MQNYWYMTRKKGARWGDCIARCMSLVYGPPMTANWVTEAIAAQEEYLKQVRSCMNEVGRPHTPRPAGDPKTGESFTICVVCGVKNPKNFGNR